MKRGNLLVRVCRALSGKTQKDFGEATGVHPTLLAEHELGTTEPGPETLERVAQGVNLTVEEAEQVLRFADTQRRQRYRADQGVDEITQPLTKAVTGVYQRLLRAPLPERAPRAEDRQEAAQQWVLLENLTEEEQWAVVTTVKEFHNCSLVELLCRESTVHSSRDLRRAAHLARLARSIADRVEAPEGVRKRSQGFAEAHVANTLRVPGKLREARASFEEAKRLWLAGDDPEQLLDPGRLLDLEASLCRAERRFGDALACLDEALVIGRAKGRILVNKSFTLEVMGEYGRAIETLLAAAPLVEAEGDPRLLYMQRFNLGVNYLHLGRVSEAAGLAWKVREAATELGDEIFLIRVTWLEGRLAAGQGRTGEALRLLQQARQDFARWEMAYDVALALLEEAVLLLDHGRTTEVKELALELQEVFAARGIHREALAALKLFAEAAKQEAATAEWGRKVLRYLFRARHDEGLKVEEV